MARNRDISDPRFWARVEALRLERGLTRDDLAARAGVHPRTILDIERGRRSRSQDGTLMAIASALDVALQRLFDFDTPLTAEEVAAAGSPPETRSVGAGSALWITVVIAVALVAVAMFTLPQLRDTVYRGRSASDPVARDVPGAVELDWDGGHIWVRDLGSQTTLWSSRHPDNKIESVIRVRWDGAGHVVYGLSGNGPDCGKVIARDLHTGETAWEDGPDRAAAMGVFGDGLVAQGTFLCARVDAADIDGDGVDEIVADRHHTKWYPTYVRIYRADGSVVGDYFHRGFFDDLHTADIDGDDKEEVVVGGTNNTPAYQGATVLILDDVFHSGASVDSLCTLAPGLVDSSRVRVVFPNFDEPFASLLNCVRPRVRGLRSYQTNDGSTRIQFTISTDVHGVLVVVTDANLEVISHGIADTYRGHTAGWTEEQRRRFEGGYLGEWLETRYRYGVLSRPIDAQSASR